MTKRDAEVAFRRYDMPLIRARFERSGRHDWPARRTAWNDYVDGLQKSGLITEAQASRWTPPACTRRAADR